MSLLQRLADAWAVLNGYHMQGWSADRQRNPPRSQEAKKEINYAVRRSLVDWSRDLEKKDPFFNRFLDLCEQYVVGPNGLRIVSASKDAKFAADATAVWEAWCPYADISSRFSFNQRQSLIEREAETVGETFIYLCFGSTNRPRIQLFESESCETPPELAQDPTISDGIRYEPTGRPRSYFFKVGEEKGVPKFQEIAAESIVHIGEPSRINQGRYLPITYAVLKDLIDLTELQNFEMLAAKDAARTSKVIKTKNGEALSPAALRRQQVNRSTQDGAGNTVTETKSEYYEKVVGAETVVLQRDDELMQFASNRPSVAVQSFWDYVSARSAAGLGLPLEIMVMRSIQGTMARGAFDMANSFFRCRSASRAESFARVWEHVIGNDLSLRRNLPPDWRAISYTPPKAINVDVGRNSAAMINELKVGATNFDLIYGPLGLDWKVEVGKWLDQRQYIKEEEAKRGLPHVPIGEVMQPPAQGDLNPA